jgi:predicted phosphodiesterase
MRYTVISDIHGNLEALKAVVEAISKEDADAYLMVGDVVGYGANPSECIKIVKSLNCQALVAGNHEWGVLDMLGLGYFNEYAKAAITWTKERLTKDEKAFLKSFDTVYKYDILTLVHGTLDLPEEFHYTITEDDARDTFRVLETPICFVGHSHVPAIFCSNGPNHAEELDASEITIDRTIKYVINVGSVGQPRDGDPRASYAVLDDVANTVSIKRVEYDIKKAQQKIRKAALPDMLASRLAEGR